MEDRIYNLVTAFFTLKLIGVDIYLLLSTTCITCKSTLNEARVTDISDMDEIITPAALLEEPGDSNVITVDEEEVACKPLSNPQKLL